MNDVAAPLYTCTCGPLRSERNAAYRAMSESRGAVQDSRISWFPGLARRPVTLPGGGSSAGGAGGRGWPGGGGATTVMKVESVMTLPNLSTAT
jgi:hypothetical protein